MVLAVKFTRLFPSTPRLLAHTTDQQMANILKLFTCRFFLSFGDTIGRDRAPFLAARDTQLNETTMPGEVVRRKMILPKKTFYGNLFRNRQLRQSLVFRPGKKQAAQFFLLEGGHVGRDS